MEKQEHLENFRTLVAQLIDNHPIVKSNEYTQWFSEGNASLEELKHFTVQFSVFSHLFIEAQLRKCINALDLESYRASKEILLNELGVPFANNGSIEGGRFKFSAAHFEWLFDFAKTLGLQFSEIGKHANGSKTTLAFCNALKFWYGSDDWSAAAGASYAVEHWAAAGFWKELIAGLQIIRAERLPDLPLGFWIWHDRLEDQHTSHTNDELMGLFLHNDFSSKSFILGAKAILDAIAMFWNGLESDRIANQLAKVV